VTSQITIVQMIRFETPVNDPLSHKETKPLGQVRVSLEQASDYKQIETLQKLARLLLSIPP